MSQAMQKILNSETQDKQAMYGMRLTSGQQLITVVIWSEYENVYEIDQFGGILYLSIAEMEFVALSDTVLNALARKDSELKRAFSTTVP